MDKNITIELDEAAMKLITKNGYDLEFGARPLKRAIYEIVEDKLADLILEDKIGEGSVIDFDVQDNEVVVKIN